MSVLHLLDPLMLWLPNVTWSDVSYHLLGQSSIGHFSIGHFSMGHLSIAPLSIDPHHPFEGIQTLLAQQFDTDPFRGARGAFANFVRSGQAWALLIGFIIGYIVRGLTTYG